MKWIKEKEPMWNESRENIIGNNPCAFNLSKIEMEAPLSGDWWTLLNDTNETLGYGWIKYEENDAELSISIHKNHQNKGVGTEILRKLEIEALNKGFKKTVTVVRECNPTGKEAINWLYKQDYKAIWPGINSYLSKEIACKYLSITNITLEKELK
ncbi:GNAT family N-acetyltransferase [Ornithinibacillus sp. L9]|uniref:GNAT family N-acetyltransferase n=1 Tax=Ornithinibacillus caprae TaxID=2678566 RepID=A0A6N8FMR7_9BACI|nr:GNAT family N-acetyltransferase [Ornithinibacillus caprae]MUK89307.1 GNAT family N-acetyltransferase [Ornithinibacillus caprae]